MVEGHCGAYSISSFGRVKNNVTGHILAQTREKDGYLKVHLRFGKEETISVHTLVANYYLKNVDGRKEINHKDLNKTNNRADNLEWCTHKENCIHAVKNGVWNSNFVVVCDAKNNFTKTFPSIRSAANAMRMSRFRVKKMCETGDAWNGIKCCVC